MAIKQTEFEFKETKRGKSLTLADLNKNLKNNYANLTKVLRPELNKLIKHEVSLKEIINLGGKLTENLPKLIATLANFYALAGNQGFFGPGDPQDKGIVEGGGGAKRFGRVESAYDEVVRKTKALFDARFFNGKDFGHQDVTVVGLRLVGVIGALENLEQSIRAVGVKRRGGRDYVRESAVEKLPVKTATLKAKTIGELRKAKRVAQKMLIGVGVLEKLPTNKSLNPKQKWINLAEEVNKISNKQEFITSTKQKYFDVLNGISNIKLKVETKNDNSFKAFYEGAFGTALSNVLDPKITKSGAPTALNANFKKEFLDKIDVTGIVGSPSLQEGITKGLVDIALGKKSQRKKFKATKTTKVKPATYKMPVMTSGKNLLNLEKKAKSASKFIVGTKLKAPVTREKGGGSTQRELNKLMTQINRRLPAEVRRNMGRPALINRTGTFSNSVELTGIRQGPKTLIGTYTYQANPYRTFENEGVRQWPNGYNPKPLIAKSIRNLAEQYTVEKFTLRRV